MRIQPLSVALKLVGCCILLTAFAPAARAEESPPEPPRISEKVSEVSVGASPARPDVSGRQEPINGRLRPSIGTGRLSAPSGGAPLGEPGFSLRSIGLYGHAMTGYFDDTDHLNYPFAVGTTPGNVWIGDTTGERALEFTPGGSIVSQIGVAGYRYGVDGTSLESVAEVAQDSSGNVWLADTNADHVVELDGSGAVLMDLGSMWDPGTGNDQFYGPRGIAFDSSGNVYIADNGNARIQIFNSSGSYLATIGESGVTGTDNAHFYCPNHIAIDSGDLLYIPDTCNARVQIFDVSTPTAATYVATMGVTGVSGSDNAHFSSPIGVAVNGSVIYVADFRNQRVQAFDHDTRAYLSTIGTGVAGSGNDQFNLPSDVAIDSSGNVYVADQLNFRVQEFDSGGTYVRTYGTTGVPYLTDGSHYNRPTGFVRSTGGSMYLIEGYGDRLDKLDSGGNLLWSVGEAGVEGSGNDHFISPNDVDLDMSGNVYVTDTGNHRVQIFTSSGGYSNTLGVSEGTGNDQFEGPNGLAIGPDGRIYVADTYNQRIQIFSSGLAYQGTIGETGVPGSDNAHFFEPSDVAVDGSSNLFVADRGNHRIQVFNSAGSYVRTIGETGVGADDFGHLASPISVGVDSAGRTYVGDQWGGRIQVFDDSGAYLTTIGWLDQIEGITFDPSGNLYAADSLDHTIRVYTPGVPGWVQSNLNGFGSPYNVSVLSVEPFGTDLYAGTGGNPNGAEVWRLSGGSWSSVATDGFGHTYNYGIDDIEPFGSDLYASTWSDESNGGEIYRSSNGTSWTRVVAGGFGDVTNAEVFKMAVFDSALYASTWSYTSSHGAELWRSNTGDNGSWSRVVSDGFGDSSNVGIVAVYPYGGYLYAATYGGDTGSQIWRSSTGDLGSWSRVNSGPSDPGSDGDGFTSLLEFDGALYASTIGGSMLHGSEIWRCVTCDGSDWVKVVADGAGDPTNHGDNGLISIDGALYWFTYNRSTGVQIWSSNTGDSGSWHEAGIRGFGDVNSYSPYWSNSIAVYGNRLFVGVFNEANGGELWMRLARTYLPLIMR